MPRGRRNQIQFENIDLENEMPVETRYIIQKPPSFFVADFLKNNHYEMMKELKKSQECSICMEDMMCCKNCYTLLNCGHSFHLCCIIKCSTCPLCRN